MTVKRCPFLLYQETLIIVQKHFLPVKGTGPGVDDPVAAGALRLPLGKPFQLPVAVGTVEIRRSDTGEDRFLNDIGRLFPDRRCGLWVC